MAQHSAPPPDGRSLTARVMTAARQVGAAIEAQLAPEQLGVDDWLVIEALAEVPELAMSELRSRTLTSAPTLTRVIDRLVTRALVYREVDAEDRRRVRLQLSKRGIELYRRLAPNIQAAEHSWLTENPEPAAVPWLGAGFAR
ncbi:MarR family transcriptional regulator [Nocardia panacis]|uniref:MarR family transcriptional regulator n=1 Tax=Nocardia panacis TaxID=2340916 RepID=A0A3A4L4X0_9NOCA|nr:MarR family transcriptional regulator [Nocardia panacis]RJO77561.1 MarR family transcriptional regulator [Nocardia panacis]